jgi:RND family efflux transporter MFP subunit
VKRALTLLFTCAVLAALGVAGWMGYDRYRGERQSTGIPVAEARQGEFSTIVPCRGEVKAGRMAQIYAPFVPNLRISWMAPAGEFLDRGEAAIRFDSTTGQQELIQKEAALKQAQASREQAKAQARITSEHDAADLVDANFQVELARIKTATNEFISRLEAERNQIDLGVAEQKLRMQEAAVEQHRVSDQARLASLERQLEHAEADLDLTRNRLNRMEITAPLAGYFVVSTNYNQGSANSQPFKIGDTVNAGISLAVIPDMATLMMDVRVEEIDRGRIAVGNDVRVRVDSVPELVIPARITQISPLAELSLEGTISRNFRAYAALANPDPRIRPGMNGGMDIIVDRIPDAITVPAKAVFTHDGKPVVYVSRNGNFEATEVEMLARNPDEIAIAGIPAGSRVALVEPASQGAAQ